MRNPASRKLLPPGRRLVFRVYLVSLSQVVLILLAAMAVSKLLQDREDRPERRRWHQFILGLAAEQREDLAAMRKRADQLLRETGTGLTLYDIQGRLLISTDGSTLPHLTPAQLVELALSGMLPVEEPNGSRQLIVPVEELDGGMVGYGVVRFKQPPVPRSRAAVIVALVLIGVAVVSILFARQLVRPLVQLREAARRFGSGELTARSGLRRPDEFGELAQAFDEMADRIAHLVRAQTELLGNVSHELRTPLARMQVALDLAREAETDQLPSVLDEMTEDVAELERLVEELLTLARIDLAGPGKRGAVASLQIERFELADFLARSVARFRSLYPSRPVSMELATPLPELEADRGLLTRVVHNLLENAHKYSEPERPILLRARSEAEQLIIEVTDQGPGIPPADLPHVFTPLFRGDRSRNRSTGGAGLGLALARAIIEAHGGQIGIESQLGVGTTVRFSLPCGGEHPQPEHRAPAAGGPASGVGPET